MRQELREIPSLVCFQWTASAAEATTITSSSRGRTWTLQHQRVADFIVKGSSVLIPLLEESFEIEN